MNSHIKRAICALMVVLQLTGCGSITETINADFVKTEVSVMERQNIENPASLVKIEVDLNGYCVDDSKKVFFIDALEDTEFRLVDASTKKVLYIGEIQQTQDYGIGDFSDFEIEGEYQIEANGIGYSYPFVINENNWEKLLKESFEKNELYEVQNQSLSSVALGLHAIMFSLACYPNVFEQDNAMVITLLKMANYIVDNQSEDGSFLNNYDDTAVCAGVLLMCSEQFSKYDEQVAKDFEDAASKANKWMEANAEQKNENTYFYYIAQDFHKSDSKGEYKKEIEDYLITNIDNLLNDKYIFWGTTLYLSTVNNVDRDLCTRIMQRIVLKTEDISRNVKEYIFHVDKDTMTLALNDAVLICFIDYITPSREYMEIIKNTMHYLNGANIKNEILLNNQEYQDIYDASVSLLCLAAINNKH